jgi:hypothetical protein
MTGGNAVLSDYPLGFEQREFRETHENRVERAGLQSRFAAQLVTVPPGGRVLDKAFENTESLCGYSRSLHQQSLHI